MGGSFGCQKEEIKKLDLERESIFVQMIGKYNIFENPRFKSRQGRGFFHHEFECELTRRPHIWLIYIDGSRAVIV